MLMNIVGSSLGAAAPPVPAGPPPPPPLSPPAGAMARSRSESGVDRMPPSIPTGPSMSRLPPGPPLGPPGSHSHAPPPPAPPGPPPPMGSPGPPPPPMMPKSMSSPSLREAPAGGDSRSDLLSAIRGGTQLRKVDVEALPDISTLPEAESKSIVDTLAMAIQARRLNIHVEDDEEEEDENEEDDEWSD